MLLSYDKPTFKTSLKALLWPIDKLLHGVKPFYFLPYCTLTSSLSVWEKAMYVLFWGCWTNCSLYLEVTTLNLSLFASPVKLPPFFFSQQLNWNLSQVKYLSWPDLILSCFLTLFFFYFFFNLLIWKSLSLSSPHPPRTHTDLLLTGSIPKWPSGPLLFSQVISGCCFESGAARTGTRWLRSLFTMPQRWFFFLTYLFFF